MQKLYWRPAHVFRVVYVLIAIVAVVSLLAVERFRVTMVQPHYEEKLEAAKRMKRGMEVIRTYRVRNVARVDTEIDPTNSGMIGLSSSSTTTNTGSLDAKRTTANPNWAAVVVDLLRRAGVERGDLVAVGVSGSFPALNLAAFSAIEILDLEPIAIASTGASSWGANFQNLTWLDMERVLNDAEIISHRSVAASLGGTRDRAIGMSSSGRRRLRRSIERAGATFLETDDDLASIEQRMDIYLDRADGRRIAAYINAGGSLVSIGPKSVKHLYRPGLNIKLPPRAVHVDSVMKRFLADGVPVINLSKVVRLAESYGMPVEPLAMPGVGEGLVFERQQYSRLLVTFTLVVLVVALYGLLKLDFGTRIVALGARGRPRPIEPMV